MDPFLGGLITTGLGAIFSGISGQSQADARNDAIRRQYQYDLQSWKYGKKRVKADYRQDVKQWKLQQQNEETLAAWKDATNLQDWQYALKIQDFEYASQMRQYRKSEQLYGQQLTFNKMAMAAANEAEHRKLEDATKELAFQNQDIVMKALKSQNVAAVKNQQGRSAAKSDASELFALGNNQAILAESLLSAKADTDAALRKIANDKFGADLAAQAARMLKPERAPRPPQPLTTPRAEFLKPRRPKQFDFGPRPIKGAAASSMGSWLGAAGDAISGIAGAAMSGSKFNFSQGSGATGLGSSAFGSLANNTNLAYSGISLL